MSAPLKRRHVAALHDCALGRSPPKPRIDEPGEPAYILGEDCPMQITRAGEYGVLGLMHLARCMPGQRAMIDEVSRKERIPRSFLGKIFQQLARAGLIGSVR